MSTPSSHKRWHDTHPDCGRLIAMRAHARKHDHAQPSFNYKFVEEKRSTHSGGCDICGAIPVGKALCIEHCHETGRFRGFTCVSCNVDLAGIDKYRKNPAKYDVYLGVT